MSFGTKDVHGLQWPESDTDCMAVVFTRVVDLDVAYAYVTKWDMAIQAGGNCGVWPKAMATKFGHVYTFEPELMNYRCLQENCQEPNITAFPFALGDDADYVSMTYPEGVRNLGACQVTPGGTIPVARIDDLHVSACDFIQLDIEGYEVEALSGGLETIRAFHPVIMVEDKGLSERYGHPRGWSESWLSDEGYRVVARPERDVILVYGGGDAIRN